MLVVVGVILIVLIIAGVAGYMLYQQNQARILQDAKNSEANAANNAPYNLQVVCFSNRTDSSHLSYTPTFGYSGYITVYETFGVYNPTKFPMDATWTISLNYPSAGWYLSDQETFHESANGTAHPEFGFSVTGGQLNSTPKNANFTNYQVSVDGTYRVIGTYATYDPSTHDTYDSTTAGNTGNGIGSQNNLPKC